MDISENRSTRTARTKPEDALPVYQWLDITPPSSETAREPEGDQEPEAPSA
jgi:hypothetical protein